MEVVTANGSVVTLNEASPHQDLWRAMRRAGSSFAIATKITAETFAYENGTRLDGGEIFLLDEPRANLLKKLANAANEGPGYPGYVHVHTTASESKTPAGSRRRRGRATPRRRDHRRLAAAAATPLASRRSTASTPSSSRRPSTRRRIKRGSRTGSAEI